MQIKCTLTGKLNVGRLGIRLVHILQVQISNITLIYMIFARQKLSNLYIRYVFIYFVYMSSNKMCMTFTCDDDNECNIHCNFKSKTAIFLSTLIQLNRLSFFSVLLLFFHILNQV